MKTDAPMLRRARTRLGSALVTALATVLALAIALPAFGPTTASAATSNLAIYTDGLASGWSDWSWGASTNSGATSPVHSGQRSLAFTYSSGWAGLYLHGSTLSTAGYDYLQFYVNGGSASGQSVKVALYDANAQEISTYQLAGKYADGGSIAAGQWRLVRIPLADLGAANRSITGILLQEFSGRAQPTMYLDDLQFVAAAVATATPTPTRTPTATSTPAPTNTPVASPTPAPTNTPAPTGGNRGVKRGVNLASAEFGDWSIHGAYGADYTMPTTAELDYFAGKGLKLIRLPVRWERIQHSLYGPVDLGDDVARIDQFVAAAKARGIAVIVDVHNYGRYRISSSGSVQEYVVGSGQVPVSAYADLWGKLADHWKGESGIWAYDIMNEPHDMNGVWPQAAQAAVDAIRQRDTSHTILVAGDAWSSAGSWRNDNENLSIRDGANNLLYEAHIYFDRDNSGKYVSSYDGEGAYPNVGADRVQPFVDWLRAKGHQGYVGEYGVPDNDSRWLTVLDNFLAKLDTSGDVVVAGTYWAAGPWWGAYPLSVEPRNGADRPQMSILTRHLGW